MLSKKMRKKINLLKLVGWIKKRKQLRKKETYNN